MLALVAGLGPAAAAGADKEPIVPVHICSPDTHRAAFVVYSDGSVYYCANDSCSPIEGAPRGGDAFPLVAACEKEPFLYLAMTDGKVYRCSAGVVAPARCVLQRNLPAPTNVPDQRQSLRKPRP